MPPPPPPPVPPPPTRSASTPSAVRAFAPRRLLATCTRRRRTPDGWRTAYDQTGGMYPTTRRRAARYVVPLWALDRPGDVGDWRVHDADGKEYYWNQKTYETTYKIPPAGAGGEPELDVDPPLPPGAPRLRPSRLAVRAPRRMRPPLPSTSSRWRRRPCGFAGCSRRRRARGSAASS